MTITLTVFLTSGGAPESGLSPTIKIKNITDDVVDVAAGAMTDKGDGFYSYAFVAFDSSKLYTVLVDGGPTLADPERYVSMTVPSVQVDNNGGIV
jgi:hypothetical protein